MNTPDRIALRSFESDVRQLLKAFGEVRSQIADLQTQLVRREAEIERLNEEVRKGRRAYSNLKLARVMELDDSDLSESKQRITRLVREVNKCIRLLTADVDNIPEAETKNKESEETLEVTVDTGQLEEATAETPETMPEGDSEQSQDETGTEETLKEDEVTDKEQDDGDKEDPEKEVPEKSAFDDFGMLPLFGNLQ